MEPTVTRLKQVVVSLAAQTLTTDYLWCKIFSKLTAIQLYLQRTLLVIQSSLLHVTNYTFNYIITIYNTEQYGSFIQNKIYPNEFSNENIIQNYCNLIKFVSFLHKILPL